MDEFEERVAKLAESLKASGIAATETRAREMAADIVRTELKQTKQLDEKRFDPNLNPQQTVSAQEQSEQSAALFAEQNDIPLDVPISELVEEKPRGAPAVSLTNPTSSSEYIKGAPQETVSFPTHDDEEEPIKEVLKSPNVSEQEAVMEEAEVEETHVEVQESIPMQDAPEPAPEPVEREKPKQPKVDLTEMFNFSKR